MMYDLQVLVEEFKLEGKLYAWQWPYCKKRYVARRLIKKAIKEGKLKRHQRIVEWSSGNLAKELCNIASILMHPVTIVAGCDLKNKLPPWVDIIETNQLMNLAPGRVVSKKELSDITKKLADSKKACYLNQLESKEHVKIYTEFAKKLIKVLPKPDAYIEHVGSGATFVGMGGELKKTYPDMQVVACSNIWGDVKHAIAFDIPFEYTMAKGNDFSKNSSKIKELLFQTGINRHQHSMGNICMALQWLKQNPNKTVFTTIGD